MSQSIAAVYMRGGSSKGVFFLEADLPASMTAREAVLLRVMGSPDANGGQLDGMGAATSSTSQVAIIGPSKRPDCDVDFTFAAVSIEHNQIDWSKNCTHLSAAVGPFAIQRGLVRAQEGLTRVRIWQVNQGQRIDAFVPVKAGQVVEQGQFQQDGLAFAGAEIRLEFLQPKDDGRAMQNVDSGSTRLLPTGRALDELAVPGLGKIEISVVNAGQPVVFFLARELKLTGKESAEQLQKTPKLMQQIELIRRAAATLIGLSYPTVSLSTVCLAKPISYRSSYGQDIDAQEIDILAGDLSVEGAVHSFPGTGAIALAVACALPGTLANKIARTLPGIDTRVGHLAGRFAVGAEVSQHGGIWQVDKASLSRSARRLMTGVVHLP
jgi:2-methylaconitate cis-trans-isomerase PrpF